MHWGAWDGAKPWLGLYFKCILGFCSAFIGVSAVIGTSHQL